MAGFDPWALPRRPVPTVSKTFSDGDVTLTVTVVSLADDVIRETAARELGDQYTQRYVTGGEVDGKHHDPFLYVDPDGRGHRLNETMCRNVAMMEAMQADGPDKLDFNQIMGLAIRMPRLFRRIAEWCGEVVMKSLDGGFTQPPQENSSGSSRAAGADTPNSNSGKPSSSGASTSGSAGSAAGSAPVTTPPARTCPDPQTAG